MKKLMTICLAVLTLLSLNVVASAGVASLWEIMDAGLQDEDNFVNTGSGLNGNLNSRSDLSGDPGTRFNITLTNEQGGWVDITIGDNFDLPTNNAGIVAATGNGGDLSGYDGYTMTIYNPDEAAFMAALYMNTGWTDSPWLETNRYYQNGDGNVTWVGPGDTVTLTLDFSDAALWDGGWTTGNTVANLNHVTDIGLKIGVNLGETGQWVSGTAYNVDIVPEPATLVMLVVSGVVGMLLKRRRQSV